jgi:hypothetical protein
VSGAPWRDFPEQYGNWKTVCYRFRRYRMEGMLDRLLERLQLELNERGLIDYELWEVDSTSVPAHKSAAGALSQSAAHDAVCVHPVLNQVKIPTKGRGYKTGDYAHKICGGLKAKTYLHPMSKS